MSRTEYTVPEEVEVSGSEMFVTVGVREVEETKVGTSRGEDYFEETVLRDTVESVTLPVSYVYPEDDPGDDVTGSEAESLLDSTAWDSVEVLDMETAKFVRDGEVYLASYNTSPLDSYRN